MAFSTFYFSTSICDLPEDKIVHVSENIAWEKDSNEVQLRDIMDLFQKINGCSDVDANRIESWLEADNDGGLLPCSSKNSEKTGHKTGDRFNMSFCFNMSEWKINFKFIL